MQKIQEVIWNDYSYFAFKNYNYMYVLPSQTRFGIEIDFSLSIRSELTSIEIDFSLKLHRKIFFVCFFRTKMRIHIETYGTPKIPASFNLFFDPDAFIHHVKERIQKKKQFRNKISAIWLNFDGNDLNDHRRLSNYGVTSGSTLTLFYRYSPPAP